MNAPPPEPRWWHNPDVKWARGGPGEVADVLAAAYPDGATIHRLATVAGVVGAAPVAGESSRRTASRLLAAAVKAGLVLDFMAEVLQDNQSATLHVPLQNLLGGHLGLVNARRAVKYGLGTRSGENKAAVVASLQAVPSEPGDEPLGEIQALTSVPDGLGDPDAYLQGLLEAMWRTAMIEIGGVARGTGFLVGPDMLLTAAHVLDARNWPPRGRRPDDICARFDYRSQPGCAPANTGLRVPVVEFITGSLPTDEEVNGNVPDWHQTPDDHLDFALLRLGSQVPAATAFGQSMTRGSYPLYKAAYDFPNGPILFIVQHPLGEFRKVSYIRKAAQPNNPGNRIRYGGNTLKGSSGSAVVDLNGRLVAVHHYSERLGNYGVPVSVIAQALEDAKFNGLFTTSPGQLVATAAPEADRDPFTTTSINGNPFVNRGNLRGRIRDMAAKLDGNRLLTIAGASGSGMSYSYRYLSHIAARSMENAALRQVAPDGLEAVKINLADYRTFDVNKVGYRIMCSLLRQLGLPDPDEPMAQPAYHASTLPGLLRSGLRKSTSQWWIFLDGVDNIVAMKQSGVNEIVAALAEAANDPQIPIRLVLVGREAATFAANNNLIRLEDTAEGLAQTQVADWFVVRAQEEGRVIDDAKLRAKLDELFPDGGPPPAAIELSPKLPTALFEVLEDQNGS